MTVEGEWRQAEMSGGGGISCEDERMCCKVGNNAYQQRPLISILQIQVLILYIPKQD